MTFAVSKRDKCLLIGLFGGLFLIIAWLYVANPLKEKTAVLETENVTLKAKADLYQSINANLPMYEEQIVAMKEIITNISNDYPAHISREDEILFVSNMENYMISDLAVENITMSVPQEIVVNVEVESASTDAVTQEATAATQEVAQNVPEVHLYKQPVNYSFRCTYRGAKDMIKYIYDQTDKKSIEGLTLAYDSATGNLLGTLELNQFYMLGTDRQYQPASVPAVPKGVNDVFHTVNGSAGVNAVMDETQDEE